MKSVSNLFSALDLGSRELVALVGGGGKTSLLFALAEELHQGKKLVVTSTTTKVRHREAQRSPCIVFTFWPEGYSIRARLTGSAPRLQMRCIKKGGSITSS